MCVLAEAVADATKAIQLDPSMSKAYFRKGLVQWCFTFSHLCHIAYLLTGLILIQAAFAENGTKTEFYHIVFIIPV